MKAAKKNTAASDQEIIITRLIDAPLERVWRAWTDPKETVQWWGPHGFSNETRQRDFKEGGLWKHTMIGPDGARYPNVAKYVEIIEKEKIVSIVGGGLEFDNKGVNFRSTVTFVAKGNKTEITMRNDFGSPAMRDKVVKEYNAIEGGNQTLSRLNAFVGGQFVISRMVDAPREKIWTCWTEAERLAVWFGPKGFETIKAVLDFRPGGLYHYGIRGNGIDVWGKWMFREIDKPKKLVFISAFSDKNAGLGRHPFAPTWPLQSLTTVYFQNFGPKTLITLYWQPYEASAAELATFAAGKDSMTQGWNGTWERLDAYLKEGK